LGPQLAESFFVVGQQSVYHRGMRTPAKPYKGMGMEGPVAKWYARLTQKSIQDYKDLAARMAAELEAGARVLEVAPGPGYFAIELAKLGSFEITGLDISETCVQIARENARREHVEVAFQQGNASEMPFASNTFDFLFCRAAFKNFSEPVRALEEMYRVLKPGGRAVIIDLRRDASVDAVNHAIDGMKLGVVNGMLTKLTFRFMLLKRAYTKPELEQFLAQTSFQSGEIREHPMGFEIWLTKRQLSG
jgi:ubiquinone/menaquinone biosynthesis C-methylase UbiE